MPAQTAWSILTVAVVISGLLPARSALAQCEVDRLMTEEDLAYVGSAVAIDGDLALVGSYQAFGYSGAASVYRRERGRWTEEATFLNPVPWSGHGSFGGAVAIHGGMLIVGASGNSTEFGNTSGAVYVFVRDATGWIEDRLLMPAEAGPHDWLGSSLATDADRLVVGAFFADIDGVGSGAAYVFRFADGDWIDEATLGPSEPASGAMFGSSVAISGERVIVGAYTEDCAAGEGCGAAYVFRFDEAQGWVQELRLEASDAGEADHFGFSVALDGDVAVVGAYSSDTVCPDDPECDSGAAYVFRRSGVAWFEEAKLLPKGLQEGDGFGWSVAIQGDTVFVGSPSDEITRWRGSGSVTMFR